MKRVGLIFVTCNEYNNLEESSIEFAISCKLLNLCQDVGICPKVDDGRRMKSVSQWCSVLNVAEVQTLQGLRIDQVV